jgi:flavin-dependent dehydrogenase
MIPSDHADVVVVGGGPAGSATALRLAQDGWRVVLVERSHYEQPRVGETLSAAVAPALRALGVEGRLGEPPAIPFVRTRSAWRGPTAQLHAHAGTPGSHVDRRAFDMMLVDAAASAGVEVRRGWSASRVDHTSAGWRIQAVDGRMVGARILVDATGRRSRVAHLLGARREAFDAQVGVGALVRASDGDDLSLLIEADEIGWWYSAPVPGGGLAVMLFTDVDLCRAASLAQPASWSARLAEAPLTRTRLEGIALPESLGVHPASSARLLRGADSRPWIAVGDAALSVDPLSGAGVARALASASRGADVIAHQLRGGDPGGAIAGYEGECDLIFTRALEARADAYGESRPFVSEYWRRRQPAIAARAADTAA